MPEEIDPTKLFPSSELFEIQGLARQDHPQLVDLAQARLQQYLDFYEDRTVNKVRAGSPIVKRIAGMQAIVGSLLILDGVKEHVASNLVMGGGLLGLASYGVYTLEKQRKEPEIDPRVSLLRGYLQRFTPESPAENQ